MKRFLYSLLCLSVLGFFGACSDDDDNNNSEGPLSFKVPMSELDASKDGGKKLIGFTTSEDWYALLDFDIAPEAGKEWLSFSPASGKAGHHILTLEMNPNNGYDDRYATITIVSGSEKKTLRITQTTVSAMEFDKSVFNVPAEGDTIEVPFMTNRPYAVKIADNDTTWLSVVPATKAAMENYTVKIVAKKTPMLVSRTGLVAINETKEDGSLAELSQTIEIVQAGGEDKGSYVVAGASTGCTPTSVVTNADGSMDAFYLYTTSNSSAKNVETFTDGGNQQPLDVQGSGNPGLGVGPIGIRLNMATAWRNLRVVACTWGDGNKTPDGYGGIFYLKMYMWDTDYATTVAGEPVYTRTVKYNDNETVPLIGTAYFAAGDYLVTLESDKPTSGVWVAKAVNNTTFQSYMKGKLWEYVPKYTVDYMGDSFGSKAGAAYKHSADGMTWGVQRTIFSLNDDWVGGYSPTDMVVTKGSKYYYATFDKEGNQKICLARSTSPAGPWTMWNGTEKAWQDYTSTPVWTGTSAVSLVEKGGEMYVYYLQGYNLMVSKVAASNDLWPSDNFIATPGNVYTFDETLGAISIDVKYHADKNKFMLTYLKDNKVYALESMTDGTSPFVAVAEPIFPYLYPNASTPRYAVSQDGTVRGAKQYISYKQLRGLYVKTIE